MHFRMAAWINLNLHYQDVAESAGNVCPVAEADGMAIDAIKILTKQNRNQRGLTE